MLFKKRKSPDSQPWAHDPDYRTVDLQSPDAIGDGYEGHGRIAVCAELRKPLYLELGSSVLSLSQNAMGKGYVLENLTANDDRAKVKVPHSAGYDDGFVVGRFATPELQLDREASRFHLRIVSMVEQLDIIDLSSTNGTLVHTPEEPIAFLRVVKQPPQ